MSWGGRRDRTWRRYARVMADLRVRDAEAAGAVQEYVEFLRDESARRRVRLRELEERLGDAR